MLDEDKAIILWVAGGLKPSAMVVAQGDAYFKDAVPVKYPQSAHDEIEHVLKDLNLSFVKTSEVMEARELNGKERLQDVVRVYIAPKPETAQKLKVLFDDVQHNHTEIGHLLGYPATAVEAFLTDTMLPMEETPEYTETVSASDMKLLHHRLSKDHWINEVAYLTTYGTFLREASPSLYASITTAQQ